VYGTGKTDKDLVFGAASLELLEQALPEHEQQQYPLVMRPGMRLPGSSSSSGGSSAVLLASASSTPARQQQQQQGAAQVLTWRRYFHTQMAAVYSALFRVKMPRVAAARDKAGAAVQHDFVFVR
jgi:hypothetical protein